MSARFAATLILGVVSIVSSPTRAGTTLECSETLYDKTGNNPYQAPHYFVLQDGGIFRKATLHWDNKKVDLSLVTNTPATIEATGKATEYMPLPAQIDQCVTTEIPKHPEFQDCYGTVNIFSWLECIWSSDVSDHEIPIDVNVTINRVTGELKIRRRQDNNEQHDTEHYGSCKATKPLF
jgi:hypothetical protein